MAAKPKEKITLRMAKATDVIALYDLLKVYFELNSDYPRPVDIETIAWGLTIINAMGAVLAVNSKGEIVGSLGVEQGAFPWNRGVPYLNMVWIYVKPERWRGVVANQLIQAAKDIAAARKMMLRMDNIWGVEADLQDRWRQQNGFKYMGGNHV